VAQKLRPAHGESLRHCKTPCIFAITINAVGTGVDLLATNSTPSRCWQTAVAGAPGRWRS
jgi:hypothetical protein